MATCTLNAASTAFPLITNRTRAELYKVSDPVALYASIIDTTSGHPARSWAFTGLDRTNYLFQITEIDGSGNILSVLSEPMTVVPDQLDGLQFRTPEQIKVGTTIGLTAGASIATFDGTGGAPDYRGWEIRPCVIGGQNYLIKGVDYSYNISTGLFSLLQSGDVFADMQVYNIQFDDRINPAGGSTPTTFDLTTMLITNNTTLTTNDIGKQLIVEPSGTYLEITLPSISSVVSGRETHIDVSVAASNLCVKLVSYGTDAINFFTGNCFILPNETLTLYKFTRSAGVYEWRVKNAVGNYGKIGAFIYSDADNASTFNMIESNGSSLDTSQYARLYNDFVLNLPSTQVCNYDDWATGDNKYKFSYANSANPSYANQFLIPDRRDLFIRSTSSTGQPSDYQNDAIKAHAHEQRTFTAVGDGGNKPVGFNNTSGSLTGHGYNTANFGDTETRPKNFSSRLYILI